MAGSPAALFDYAEMASEIVGAYVSNNHVAVSDLPTLIRIVHDTLSKLGLPEPAVTEPERIKPPVSIRKSVTDDHLVSLEDGRHYKSLKRHLARRGLTPAEYRAKWGLPIDYPMVAPAYARRRSELAKSIGLGSMRKHSAAAAPAPDPELGAAVPAPKRGRGRPRRAP